MNTTKKLTTLGIMAALSVLLVALIHFPIFPAAPFLEYDPADIPIFISTFIFGPAAGFVLTVVASLAQGLTVSSGAGIIGFAMHVLATGAFVIVAGNIYKLRHSRKGAYIALLCGTLTMAVIMTLWNVILTPIYMGVDRSIVLGMLIPTIIPFNLIKAGVNSIITLIIYKYVSAFLKR